MPIAPWDPGGFYPFSYGGTSQPFFPTPTGSTSPGGNPSSGGAPTPTNTNTSPFTTNQQGISVYPTSFFNNLPAGKGNAAAGAIPIPGVGGTSYNAAPPPQTYNPIYGGVPGNIGIPNPFQDLSGAIPGLGGINQQAGQALSSQFAGQLSPGTINQIQDMAAQWGAGAGMPGFTPGSLSGNLGLRNLGLSAEQQIQNAFSNYGKFVPTVSQTQTVPPALEAEIAALNSFLNAAPNPAAAGSHAEQLFNAYMQGLRGPGGGTRGGGGPVGGGGGFGGFPSTGDQALGFGFGSFGGQGTGGGGLYGGQSFYQGMTPGDSNNMDMFWNLGTPIDTSGGGVDTSQDFWNIGTPIDDQSYYNDLSGGF